MILLKFQQIARKLLCILFLAILVVKLFSKNPSENPVKQLLAKYTDSNIIELKNSAVSFTYAPNGSYFFIPRYDERYIHGISFLLSNREKLDTVWITFNERAVSLGDLEQLWGHPDRVVANAFTFYVQYNWHEVYQAVTFHRKWSAYDQVTVIDWIRIKIHNG